ncbi:MAG: hypothetical protein CMN64_14415 [Sphingobium sp.]|nr:hypothetical protein [Sphingobium sp.]
MRFEPLGAHRFGAVFMTPIDHTTHISILVRRQIFPICNGTCLFWNGYFVIRPENFVEQVWK